MSHDPHTILRVTGVGELLAEAEKRGWTDAYGDAASCRWDDHEANAAEQSALDYLVDDLGFCVIYEHVFDTFAEAA